MTEKMKPSGISWIGDIPQDWNIKRVKYLASLKGRIGWQGLTSDEYTDEAGKCARNILLFKDMNGIALYRMAEEGFNAGVTDIISDANADAPVEYFNLNGVRCNNNLVPGVYITRQGTTVNKVIVK